MIDTQQEAMIGDKAARELLEVEKLKAVNAKLLNALHHYANENNWQDAFNGIPRTWLEPDSSTPNQYEGFCIARAAIKEAEEL